MFTNSFPVFEKENRVYGHGQGAETETDWIEIISRKKKIQSVKLVREKENDNWGNGRKKHS